MAQLSATRSRHATAVRTVAFALSLAGCLLAHGGQYLGPTTGPAVPGPPGPEPGTPTLVPGGPTTGGNVDLVESSWRVWWELNHARYVNRATRTGVGDDVRRSQVVPSLVHALDKTDDPDVGSASLVALGKAWTGEAHVLELLRGGLTRSHVDVREAAVLALGLAGDPGNFVDLDNLLRDSAEGRALVRQNAVDDRMRAFAAYSLGILAGRSDDPDVKLAALASLGGMLEKGKTTDRDILVGVLNGIRLLHPEPERGAAHKRVLWGAVAILEAWLERRFKDQTAAVQPHALNAIAVLVGRGDGIDAERARTLVTGWLERPGADPMAYVSATIALGKLLRPTDEDQLAVLVRRINRPPHPMVRNFGMIALGEIGGPIAFEQLRKAFRDDDREVQGWAAIGLGLLAFHDPGPTPAEQAQGQKTDRRNEVGELLATGLKTIRNRDVLAAVAIGLGLARHASSAPQLRELLDEHTGLGELAGPACVGLGLLEDHGAIPSIRAAMSKPDDAVLFGHAALGLAQLTVPDASALAVGILQSDGGATFGRLRRLAGASTALGHLGNPADLPALAKIVESVRGERRTSEKTLTVAFAAAALGAIADRDPLGFGARVADGMNYAGREQTISNGHSGILDIF